MMMTWRTRDDSEDDSDKDDSSKEVKLSRLPSMVKMDGCTNRMTPEIVRG
jgi:hypothetical protein